MKKLLKWGGIALAALVLIFIGVAIGGDSGDEPATDNARGRAAAENAIDEQEPEKVREEPNPDGRYQLNCDYVLPDDFDSEDFRFIAGGTLENTGNVGLVAHVTYEWDLLGQAPFKQQKTYRVRRGAEKDVHVSFPVTGDMIDAHQSADGDCETKVRIVDTFGLPPFE